MNPSRWINPTRLFNFNSWINLTWFLVNAMNVINGDVLNNHFNLISWINKSVSDVDRFITSAFGEWQVLSILSSSSGSLQLLHPNPLLCFRSKERIRAFSAWLTEWIKLSQVQLWWNSTEFQIQSSYYSVILSCLQNAIAMTNYYSWFN